MRKLVIFTILVLAAVLRFNQLNNLPALNADEAALGYNAYSLSLTGRDEHGNRWPIHFQSFNDYKPGLYFYLVLPFVKFFGLTEWSVRIPGALLGVGTVLLVWFLVQELFPGGKHQPPNTNHQSLPEIAALFLAISPWHIHFSRGGWEVNVATFFLALGFLFFLKGLKRQCWLFVSLTGFIASMYTYHAARLIAPLLVFGLFFVYRQQFFLRVKGKYTLFLVVVSLVLLLPLLLNLKGQAGLSRASGVGLLADPGPHWLTNEQRGEHEPGQGLISRLLHNKFVNYGLAFAGNYVDHFGGKFLFLSGDEIQRNKVPEFGQMYLFDILFLAVGLITIARNPRNWGVIILWLFLAPIPAALTFQSPHALRAQNMAIPLTIISAFGAWSLFNWINNKTSNRLLPIAYCLLPIAFVFWDFSRYLHQYYIHMAKTYDYSSQYGLKELVQYVATNNDGDKKVVVTNRYDQPYVLFLFYLKYPPEQFQKEHVLTPRDKFGFSTVEEFGNYTFREIENWDEIRRDYPGALIAGTEEEIPGGNILKTITFPSGRTAFRVVVN